MSWLSYLNPFYWWSGSQKSYIPLPPPITPETFQLQQALFKELNQVTAANPNMKLESESNISCTVSSSLGFGITAHDLSNVSLKPVDLEKIKQEK